MEEFVAAGYLMGSVADLLQLALVQRLGHSATGRFWQFVAAVVR